DLLRRRDLGVCRTPWCDAPVRHHDHVVPAGARGPTDSENGQGLCEACNHAKQAPGWTQTVVDDPDRHAVDVTTPTGHRHRSRAPDLPTPLRGAAHAPTRSAVDLVFADLRDEVAAA
ncbi:MAG TPA: HNH endonuclease, partial [Actinotalea sp.]|nr:HNH endonuclease [Actinotalea sp.]